jgi:pilus assembly protein CpaB
MTRRRRMLVLAGLSVVLGSLAASDVAGREAAVRRQLGGSVPVVTSAQDLEPGETLVPRVLRTRSVPGRYRPQGTYAAAPALLGRHAAVAIPAGTDLTDAIAVAATVGGGAPVAPGQRVAEIVAEGSASMIRPGGRVDVVVTRDTADGHGSTRLALQDAEVLEVRALTPDGGDTPVSRVAVSLRVSLSQAVMLTSAQSFAKDLRVLPRAAGDRRRSAALEIASTGP